MKTILLTDVQAEVLLTQQTEQIKSLECKIMQIHAGWDYKPVPEYVGLKCVEAELALAKEIVRQLTEAQ